MTRTTRIPKAELTGPLATLIKGFSTRKLGQVPEPLGVMWNNRRVLRTYLGIARGVDRWSAYDKQLKSLAHMAALSLVGCGFCLDFAYFTAHDENLDLEKAREVPRWRESTSFTTLEREVMEYAEAMSSTPPTVTDELSERLLAQLGAPALVELTGVVAMANVASRTNTALGIEAQGFAAACGLAPLAPRAEAMAAMT